MYRLDLLHKILLYSEDLLIKQLVWGAFSDSS